MLDNKTSKKVNCLEKANNLEEASVRVLPILAEPTSSLSRGKLSTAKKERGMWGPRVSPCPLLIRH